jgi:hypothetical protein
MSDMGKDKGNGVLDHAIFDIIFMQKVSFYFYFIFYCKTRLTKRTL